MSTSEPLAQIKQSLREYASGYLRNTVHISGQTCAACRGTRMNDGFPTCYPCGHYPSEAADVVGSVIYGVSDSQSGKVMHQYKTVQAAGLVRLVNSLASVAIKDHFACATSLMGGIPDKWATVPSLKAIGSNHPLRKLILVPMLDEKHEIKVAASAMAAGKSEQERREFNPSLYELKSAVPLGGRILLIDDTWTTGGHIQSVAALLKQNGAAKVAALTVARWLDMNDPRTKRVYTDHIKARPYDPDICPWTGSSCPPTN